MSLLLMELPLLILTLPRSIMSVGSCLYAVLFIVGCLLLDRVRKSWGPEARNVISFKIEKPFVSILMAAILGVAFFIHWSDISVSRIVQMVQSALHLSDQGLLVALGIGAGLLAVWALFGISALFRMAKQAENDAENAVGNFHCASSSKKAGISITGWDILFYTALVVTIAIVQFDTVPLYKRAIGLDSSVFLYIGKMMRQGKVPYLDFFDHKGIMLYFIQYLGILLSFPGTFSGVWLLEIVNLIAFFLLIHKTVLIFTHHKIVSYITVLIVGFLCGSNIYGGGDLTEEWALPWIALALSIGVKYFYTEKYRKRDVALLGVGCAIVALLRVNNIGIWIALIPIIIIDLIRKKRAQELFSCIGYFLVGFAIVWIPVAIYLILTGSFHSFIAYYINFNMEYSGSEGNIVNILVASAVIWSLFIPWGFFFFIFSKRSLDSKSAENSLILQVKHVGAVNFICFVVSLLLASMSGRTYGHYAMVLLPFITLPVMKAAELAYSLVRKSLNSRKRWSSVFAVTVCVFLSGYLVLNLPHTSTSTANESIADYMISETQESDDVLLIESLPRYYFETNRYTENKFFYQNPPVNISDKLCEEFKAEIENKPSDYIVVGQSRQEIFEKEDNILSVIRSLDEQAAAGVYEYEEFEDFFAYKRVKNEE